MRDDRVDKIVQTKLLVYPHVLSRSQENKLKVQCNVSVQTEAHFNIDSNIEQVVELLQYTPLSDILADALQVSEIPKKYVLKFNDIIIEESIANLDNSSLRDTFDTSMILRSRLKSNLKQLKTMEFEDVEVQTDIMVRPYILHWDELAAVYCDLNVQTSQTFPPDASLTFVAEKLHQYNSHHGRSHTLSQSGIDRIGLTIPTMPRREFPELDKSEYPDIAKMESPHIEKKHSPLMKKSETHPGVSQTDQISEIECETVNHGEVRPLKSKDGGLHDEEAHIQPGKGVVLGHACLAKDKDASRLTSKDIGIICNTCCTEEQVLAKIEEWYKNVKNMVENSEDEAEVLSKDMTAVEVEIITSIDHTVEQLETQADRMMKKYAPETHNVEVQNKEFADHLSGHNLCQGLKFRDKSCTCDCYLNRKPDLTCANEGKIMHPRKIFTTMEYSSDLSNVAPRSREPQMKPRACTLRKCNCLDSEGCGHCERALRSKEKMKGYPSMTSPKRGTVAQNIEFLSECENEYADSYLELLEQDEIGTQTEMEIAEQYFGMPIATSKPEPPCTCMADVEMPWDMLLLPPTPKRREVPTDEDAILGAIPEGVRAQLKELTVQPMSDHALGALLTDFLKDNIAESDNIEDIQKAILAEKARLEAEAARAIAEINKEEGKPPDDDVPYVRCRPRPPLRTCQVFDPEDETYNEPYMDKMLRFMQDEDTAPGECTSHVEMPWNRIELPKNVILRKSKRNPCDFKPRPKVNIDPLRKCGPEYRTMMMKRQQPNLPNPRFIPNDLKSTVRVSEPNLTLCCCHGPSAAITKPPNKGVSDTCLCGKPSCSKLWAKDPKKPNKVMIPDLSSNSSSPFQSKGSSSRTQRVAELLESCKREMEPIKEGINQLRSRIKELNLPDMLAYQDSPQQIGASTSYNYMNGMGGLGASSMVPTMGPGMGMCYPPPMMVYPYPPCMFPGTSAIPQSTSKHSLGRSGKQSKKGKNRSKSRHRCVSSKYNTSSESTSTVPDRGRRKCRCKRNTSKSSRSKHNKGQQFTKSLPSSETSSFKASSSKLICSCITTASLPPSVPITTPHTSCKPSMASCATEGTKSVIKSKIPKLVSLTKNAGNVCPASSLASQRSCGRTGNFQGTATDKDLMTKAASSVTFVRSCCTQFSTNQPKSKTSVKSQKSGCKIVIRVEPPQKVSTGVGVLNGKPIDSDN